MIPQYMHSPWSKRYCLSSCGNLPFTRATYPPEPTFGAVAPDCEDDDDDDGVKEEVVDLLVVVVVVVMLVVVKG